MESTRKRIYKFSEFLFNIAFFRTFLILMILIGTLAIFTPGHNFIRFANIMNLLSYGPELVIVALGVGMLMISGEFDLSVGSVLAFCSFIFMWLFQRNFNPFIIVVITLISGAIIGIINGLITTKGKIFSFIATLGTMLFWRGITVVGSLGETVSVDTSKFKFFNAIFVAKIGNIIPVQTFWLALLAIILGLMLHRMKFGNWMYSTGDSKRTAKAMAINTDMVKIICFMIVGLLVSFVAILQMVRVAAFAPRVGEDLALQVIAAVVIGGVSIRGGKGHMIGIVLGALIVIVIQNSLILARLPYEWNFLIFGLIIMFSVVSELMIDKKMKKIT